VTQPRKGISDFMTATVQYSLGGTKDTRYRKSPRDYVTGRQDPQGCGVALSRLAWVKGFHLPYCIAEHISFAFESTTKRPLTALAERPYRGRVAGDDLFF
jgi:hypothetical protein